MITLLKRLEPMAGITRKGGGGGGTSTSGIAPEFKPALTKGLGLAGSQLDKELGADGATGAAVASQDQLRADINAGRQVSQDALSGQGAFDNRGAVNRQLQNLQGQQVAGGLGTLGSARADRARQAALADASLQFNQLDQQNQVAGAAGLQQSGQQLRGLEQEQLDAPHKSLERYFGYLSGAPQQTTQQQSGGK